MCGDEGEQMCMEYIYIQRFAGNEECCIFVQRRERKAGESSITFHR